MLKGLEPLLTPELLYALAQMGHGDTIALVDRNFPAYTVNDRVIRLDGTDVVSAGRAVLGLLPLDTFVPAPIARMEVVGDADIEPPVQTEFLATAGQSAGRRVAVESLERHAFYLRARAAFAVVITGEDRPYGCFLLTKGVLPEFSPERARREIFGAAAEAAQLLGWSAYDAGRHGAAQRYFVQGLRLAREAEDPVLGGRLLSNLSHQANYLGRYTEALQLARAAQSAAAGRAPATVSALFLAMEARALASAGESRACADVLHRAEQEFDRRDPAKDPAWIGYFDAFELAGKQRIVSATWGSRARRRHRLPRRLTLRSRRRGRARSSAWSPPPER